MKKIFFSSVFILVAFSFCSCAITRLPLSDSAETDPENLYCEIMKEPRFQGAALNLYSILYEWKNGSLNFLGLSLNMESNHHKAYSVSYTAGQDTCYIQTYDSRVEHSDSVDFLVIPDDIILLHLAEESDLDVYSTDGSSLVVEVVCNGTGENLDPRPWMRTIWDDTDNSKPWHILVWDTDKNITQTIENRFSCEVLFSQAYDKETILNPFFGINR